MKHKTHHLYYLFYPRCRIIIAMLILTAIASAQETPPKEFVLDGSIMDYQNLFIDTIYNSYIQCGFNTMTQRATTASKPLLDSLNLHAINMQDSLQLIYWYSSAYYSKWEAEEDQPLWYKVGVKHSAGEVAYWNDGNDSVLCWSTKGVMESVDTLVYGPTYHQEKWYRRWLYQANLYNLQFTPRFRMALDVKGNVNPDEDVCRIYVLLKYRRIVEGDPDSTDSTYVLKEPITLKVSDFSSSGDFDYLYFSNIPSQRSYKYPSWLRDQEATKVTLPNIPGIYRDDRWGGTGVQFCIDWLRSDTLCTLYIDNIEVYDNNGWNYYIEFPVQTSNSIKAYADSFKTLGWTNIKYWMGGHEPSSIDSYTPIRVVDSLIQDVGAPPIMNTIWALWDLKLNEESQLERYYTIVQPNKLLVEFHPIQSGYVVPPPFAFEVVRRILQESYSLTQEKKFYYHVQSYGHWENDWVLLRRPYVPEYKATIMLALSHGADGLVQAAYDSQPWIPGSGYSGIRGLIELNYTPSDLWYELKNNLIPRIKGKLGKTLMSLNYTGDYLYLGRHLQEETGLGFTNTGPTVDKLYLTLTEYTGESTPPPPVHFHAGFFSRPAYPLDKYFMLDNLITTNEKRVWVTIEPPVPGYKNYRFRNVEGVFDTTFDGYSNEIVKLLTYPAGEGYLYQVAPVVLFGGRLLYDEYAGENQILSDDIVIENGRTPSISGDYFADGNIIIKNGSIVNYENGRIQFGNGKKLIIQGSATICGSVDQKLILDFVSKDYENGVTIREGGSLNISYCKIKNASVGITSELNANYFNIHHVDFEDCGTHSINIFGRGIGQLLTPPSQIKFCSITNSNTGISAANMSEIIIQKNFITNTERGILLSQVTNSLLVENIIQSNLESMEGIFASSIGGVIRGNYITGHTVGIHLGNSSPDIGANTVTYCKTHAMYLGTGSNPNMVGRFAKDASRIYPISGYNNFINNGGYEGEGDDNDGSEIYFNESNAIMREGCNSIVDDREPDCELRNTLLLMNCPREGSQIEIRAEYNYWGETRICDERFGNLTVYFDPYYTTACPLPDQQFDDEALITKTSSGEVIDTLFPATEDYYSLSGIKALYALAGESFVTGDLESAENYYNQITSADTTLTVLKEAYCRKYEIGKILNRDASYFSELRNLYSSLSGSTSDSLLKKIFYQLASLCLTAQEEYVPAINEFDEIIQQNPNTEEAVYAEIDALTTALLIEGEDSTLQKGRLGKYLVKASGDYNQRVDEILRKNFGSESKETEEEILPTEYTLYQNYPNPFNPITTIKYDLPNTSDVSLIIYDILGRKVKELINEKQQAGRYEVQLNASNLASGVYIYQLIAEKYVSSKKMILLK